MSPRSIAGQIARDYQEESSINKDQKDLLNDAATINTLLQQLRSLRAGLDLAIVSARIKLDGIDPADNLKAHHIAECALRDLVELRAKIHGSP